MGRSFPQNCSFPWGIWTPITHRKPPESTTQTGSRSVQSFLQDLRLWQIDRHTTLQVGRIYVRNTAMINSNNKWSKWCHAVYPECQYILRCHAYAWLTVYNDYFVRVRRNVHVGLKSTSLYAERYHGKSEISHFYQLWKFSAGRQQIKYAIL